MENINDEKSVHSAEEKWIIFLLVT
jgi:hypothetical protein